MTTRVAGVSSGSDWPGGRACWTCGAPLDHKQHTVVDKEMGPGDREHEEWERSMYLALKGKYDDE